MLINSSLDILWLAIALVVLWIGIWMGFTAYYLMLSVKDGRHVISSIKKKLEFIDGLMSMFKKKAENTSTVIPPLVDGVTKLMEAYREGKKKDKKTKK